MNCTAFQTQLNWFGLQWTSRGVSRVTIGQPSKRKALNVVANGAQPASNRDSRYEELCQRLIDFAEGAAIDFGDVALDLPLASEFQRRVLDACRAIPYGETLTYAQLASIAGSPRAARAVGNVMAKNRVPILVPCHRVVGSQHSLGGFSAPTGVTLKQRMLDLEGWDAGSGRLASRVERRARAYSRTT